MSRPSTRFKRSWSDCQYVWQVSFLRCFAFGALGTIVNYVFASRLYPCHVFLLLKKLLIVDCDRRPGPRLLLIIQAFDDRRRQRRTGFEEKLPWLRQWIGDGTGAGKEAVGAASMARLGWQWSCAFVTMFTQIFKDNPTISKGLLCNFSSHFIVAASGSRKMAKKKKEDQNRPNWITKCKMSISSCKQSPSPLFLWLYIHIYLLVMSKMRRLLHGNVACT